MACNVDCRFAQICLFRTENPECDEPENCPEYWKLEDFWWDAQNGHEPEDYDNFTEEDEEDDFTEEDMS